MNSLVQAEMSVLVDVLYHPDVLFPSGVVDRGFSSGGFMTKYAQLPSFLPSLFAITLFSAFHLLLFSDPPKPCCPCF